MKTAKELEKLEQIKKGAQLLRGSIGSMCRGYLDGYLGMEPNAEKEADVEKYENGWLEGAEKRKK